MSNAPRRRIPGLATESDLSIEEMVSLGGLPDSPSPEPVAAEYEMTKEDWKALR